MAFWHSVPGYDFLEASEYGDLRTKDRYIYQRIHGKRTLRFCAGQVLHQSLNTRGRLIVGVLGKSVQVSRLVCSAFHGLPTKEKPWALHEDDIPTNNHIDNLFWGTPSENAKMRFQNKKAA